MQTLGRGIRYSVRRLLKQLGLTIVPVMALSLGISANTALISVVNEVRETIGPAASASDFSTAQAPLEGRWVGGAEVLGQQRFVQVVFSKEQGRLAGSLDIPSANAVRLPLRNIRNEARLSFEVDSPRGIYSFAGDWKNGAVVGALSGPGGVTGKLHLVPQAAVDARLLESYAGDYQGQTGQLIQVICAPSGLLTAVFTELAGTKEMVARTTFLIPSDEKTFFTSKSAIAPPEDRDETVTFNRGAEGGVTGLVWRQPDGATQTAPRVPSPFRQEQVSFRNGEVRLEGTLLCPLSSGPHRAVVIVHGSGPVTRDAPALFLRARRFAQMGLAVLLYDKRGAGHSGGDQALASYDDFAGDALAGVRFLQARPEINPRQIGLQGNSEAGWVIPLAAGRSKDLAFVIIGSGGGVSQAESQLYEAEAYLKANKFAQAEVEEALQFTRLKWKYALTGEGWEAYEAQLKKAQTRKWFNVIDGPLSRDPAAWQRMRLRRDKDLDAIGMIEQIKIPLLLLFGEPQLDLNHPVTKAIEGWGRGLKNSGHQDYAIRNISGVGHALFFRAANGRTVLADETFEIIGEWLSKKKT